MAAWLFSFISCEIGGGCCWWSMVEFGGWSKRRTMVRRVTRCVPDNSDLLSHCQERDTGYTVTRYRQRQVFHHK